MQPRRILSSVTSTSWNQLLPSSIGGCGRYNCPPSHSSSSRPLLLSSLLTTNVRRLSFGQKNDDGVPLAPGSFLQRVHAKTRAHVDQGLVFHIGKALTLLTCFSNEIYLVRFALIFSSLLSTVFHFVFPDPRPVRMFYGLLFAIGHVVALSLYCYERSDSWQIPDDEDRRVYEQHFKTRGFTKYHFLKMREFAEYVDYKAGDIIHAQGGDIDCVMLIIRGGAYYHRAMKESDKVNFHSQEDFERHAKLSGNIRASEMKEGGWIGEIYDRDWDPEAPHHWISSCTATSDVRALKFQKKALHAYFAKGARVDNVESAALIAQVKDLWMSRRVTAAANSLRVATLEARIAELEQTVQRLEASQSSSEKSAPPSASIWRRWLRLS